MIKRIEVENYRGIKKGVLDDLTALVVLVGPNGCGKSSMLDVPLIAANATPFVGLEAALARRASVPNAGRWMVPAGPAGENGAKPKFRVTTSNGHEGVTVLEQPDPRHFSRWDLVISRNGSEVSTEGIQIADDGSSLSGGIGTHPLSGISDVKLIDTAQFAAEPLHSLFSKIVKLGLRAELLSVMTSLIPRLHNIEILAEGETPFLSLVFDGFAMPAAMASDGEHWVLRMSCELVTRPGGLVLIEEPETHLHPRAMRVAAKTIRAIAARGTQIMLTTHSLEFIDDLLSDAANVEIGLLSVYRLKLDGGQLVSSRLSGEDVFSARVDISSDLR